MFCHNCGHQSLEGAVYCQKCGGKLISGQSVQQVHYEAPAPPIEPAQPPIVPAPPLIEPASQQQYNLPQQWHVPQPVKPETPAKKQSTGLILGIVIAAVVLVLGIGTIWLIFNRSSPDAPYAPAIESQRTTRPDTSPANNAQETPFTPAQIFENNKDATFRIIGDPGNGYIVFGTGFFISSGGVAVTNHHVMDGVLSAFVVLHDGREFDVAGYYSYDFENDLAIIQVDGGGERFQAVTVGDSDALSVGDRVYAIGGPGGDPLTLTEGIISRFAHEPIEYYNYTVAGMLQSTAFIYGGNSGGPLINDRGQVIGINSAGRADRESTQWAVPVNRVDVPYSDAQVNSLPVGSYAPFYAPGQIAFYSRYPFIPDFQSVSSNATLEIAGTADDLGFDLNLDIDEEGDYHFDYALFYWLEDRYFVPDTDVYDDVLEECEFIFQDSFFIEGVYCAFFYHPRERVSLAYLFDDEYEFLCIAIGKGNALS